MLGADNLLSRLRGEKNCADGFKAPIRPMLNLVKCRGAYAEKALRLGPPLG